MIYFLNIVAVIFLYLVLLGNKRCEKYPQRNKVFWILVSIHAILFRALANPENFTDTNNYNIAFERVLKVDFADYFLSINPVLWGWGYGFQLVQWLITLFTSDYQYQFFVFSILTLAPIFYFYKRCSHDPIFTVLFFLAYPSMYYMGIGVMRQHLSIAFCLLALLYFDRKSISYVLTFIAVLFHPSSLIFIPFYIWNKVDVSRINTWKLILMLSTCVIVFKAIISTVVSFIPRYEYATEEGSNNILPAALLGSFMFLSLKSGVSKKTYDKTEKVIINACYYGLFVALVALGQSGMGRLPLLFLYLLPVAITFLRYRGVGTLVYRSYTIMIYILIIYLIGKDTTWYEDYSFFWQPQVIYF